MASDLVLQHDDGNVVWATRGYSIYRSVDGSAFSRVARIRLPLGAAWGGCSRTLRRLSGYQELMELLPLPDKRVLVVFAGGYLHRLDLEKGKTRRTHQARYFGLGKGRGLMAYGLTRGTDGAIYFAEYVTASGDRPIGILRSRDDGETWELAYEFKSGRVRHVHVVQSDPYDGAIWIGTGDRDEHCFVGRSHDGAQTFVWVGHGKQIYRTCAFGFFPNTVVWATDADFEANHVVRWQRATGAMSVDAGLPDATYYAAIIDDERLLLGLAQGVAEVWVARSDGTAQRWLDWSVRSERSKRGPPPGVRLARGNNRTGALHVNPLRTRAHEAAIFRFERTALPSA